MENKILREMELYLDDLRNREKKYTNRLAELSDYTDLQLRQVTIKREIPYYASKVKGPAPLQYLGNQKNPTVILIQEAHYVARLLDYIRRDITLIEKFLDKFVRTDFLSVNERLPKVYRNHKAIAGRSRKRIASKWKKRMEEYKATFPEYKPEEKKHTTDDGTLVRSKSEALIYNHLLHGGYTFVYELPLKTTTRTFYPDFTILSEIDYKTVIIIEHQGMMDDVGYRERANQRIYDYWSNGYLPGRDVYFTYDDNSGGFDITPVVEILRSRVRQNETFDPDGAARLKGKVRGKAAA